MGEWVLDTIDSVTNLQMRLAEALQLAQHTFDVIFPSGEQLSNLVQAQPSAHIDSLVNFDK